MKLFSQFVRDLTEKGLSNTDIQDLIDRARSSAKGVADDDEKSTEEKERGKEVVDWVNDVEKTFSDKGKLHPNSVNGLMRIVSGVGSGRYGRSNPPDGRVPANYKK